MPTGPFPNGDISRVRGSFAMSSFYTVHKMATSSYKSDRDTWKNTLNVFFNKHVLRHILSLQKKHVLG